MSMTQYQDKEQNNSMIIWSLILNVLKFKHMGTKINQTEDHEEIGKICSINVYYSLLKLLFSLVLPSESKINKTILQPNVL